MFSGIHHHECNCCANSNRMQTIIIKRTNYYYETQHTHTIHIKINGTIKLRER